MYFNKSAKDVTLDEAATIASIIQTPARLSPFVNPERTLARRNNYVLPRMAEGGVCHATGGRGRRQEADRGSRAGRRRRAAHDGPVFRRGHSQEPRAAFRRRGALRDRPAGADDARRRAAASRRARRRPRPAASRQAPQRLPEGEAERRRRQRDAANLPRAALESPDRRRRHRARRRDVAARSTPAGSARIRIASTELDLPRAAFAWTRKTNAAELFAVGDVIEVAVGAVEKGQFTQLTLEQPPIVEGALVALDNRTGQIRAMVGGFDFARSKFNRATQARRQVGSLFKPVLYSAAIDKGFTAETVFIDEPVSYIAGRISPLRNRSTTTGSSKAR
jgi:penicillin-binding protein 1A